MSQHLAVRHRFRRLSVLLCILTFLLTSFHYSANALDFYVLSGYHLTDGITNVTFHYSNPVGYSSNYNVNYLSDILLSANSWVSKIRSYTGERISVTYSSSDSSDIRYIFINSTVSPYDSNLAGCIFYNANGTAVPTAGDADLYPSPAANYTYVEIILNQANVKNISSSADFRLLSAHEKGHAFGLRHMIQINYSNWDSVSDCQSIMYEYTQTIYADHGISAPTATDCRGVIAAN